MSRQPSVRQIFWRSSCSAFLVHPSRLDCGWNTLEREYAYHVEEVRGTFNMPPQYNSENYSVQGMLKKFAP
jgi:hypothetical protein